MVRRGGRYKGVIFQESEGLLLWVRPDCHMAAGSTVEFTEKPVGENTGQLREPAWDVRKTISIAMSAKGLRGGFYLP